MLFFTLYDFVRPGKLHFGSYKLAGLVISTIITLAGIYNIKKYNTKSPSAGVWFGALLFVYFAGMLFLGLKPSGHFFHYPRQLLITSRPPIKDFIINILGFVPFAYLLMAFQFSGKKPAQPAITALTVLAAGICFSLFIELVQYYIPGRTSSLMDLIGNTAGTAMGIVYFLIEKKFAAYRQPRNR